jgi:pyruvate kinase
MNDRTGYVIEGTKLRLVRGKEVLCEDEVGTLPEVEDCLSLSAGDDLLLTSVEVPGKAAEYRDDEVIYQPAQIGCSLSAVFTNAGPGERIFFDDGSLPPCPKWKESLRLRSRLGEETNTSHL